MKKEYFGPDAEIIEFVVKDVIMASSETDDTKVDGVSGVNNESAGSGGWSGEF